VVQYVGFCETNARSLGQSWVRRGLRSWPRQLEHLLFKDFSISEARGSRLELRLETFNTFNHVQWNSPDGNFSSGTFGRVNGAADPRTLQLGLKLYF
jgi:hypothetical protein